MRQQRGPIPKPPGGVRIQTGARLHFGLQDIASPFGGAGMMIDGPKTLVSIQDHSTFQVKGPGSSRVHAVVKRFAEIVHLASLPNCQITIQQRPSPHTGLGSGTQLAMAVACALKQWFPQLLRSDVPTHVIAGRGERSRIGSYGFESGGFIVDQDPITHYAVPDPWHIVLLCPQIKGPTISGKQERALFADLPRPNDNQRSALRDLLLEKIVPALEQSDFDAFCDSLFQYNYHSGMLFAPVQHGAYNGPEVYELVNRLRESGFQGVGQSSWGPTVFAFCDSAIAAQRLSESNLADSCLCQLVRPANDGYQTTALSQDKDT